MWVAAYYWRVIKRAFGDTVAFIRRELMWAVLLAIVAFVVVALYHRLHHASTKSSGSHDPSLLSSAKDGLILTVTGALVIATVIFLARLIVTPALLDDELR